MIEKKVDTCRASLGRICSRNWAMRDYWMIDRKSSVSTFFLDRKSSDVGRELLRMQKVLLH